jgi:type VI secretion system secreted protein VgrG
MSSEAFRARLESTEFSCEGLQVHHLTGREAIGQLFEFDVEVAAAAAGELLHDTVVGSAVSIVWSLGDTDVRTIHGMVATMEDVLDPNPKIRIYRLRVHPRAFRLALVQTNEIFLEQSVPDIIQRKLSLVGLQDDDVVLRLTGSYPKREIVTQYKETDLAFVSRLAEHLGVSIFFEQANGKDQIVFTDHPDGFRPIVREEPIVVRPHGLRSDVHTATPPASLASRSWSFSRL